MMNLFRPTKMNENGTILLVFLITLPFLIAICISYMSTSLTSYTVGRADQFHSMAQLAADAGADYAVEKFSSDNSWTGVGETTLHSDSQIRTTYQASISGTTTAKTVSVIGKTYSPASATTPKKTVKIYVDLRPTSGSSYSVLGGAGGLYMTNSAKILGGSVFVNGEINMSNSSTIGLLIFGVDVQAADMICPSPATAAYPRVCAAGENGQPITMSGPSHIYGQVKATNQTDGSKMSLPGLVPNQTVAPQSLPVYDRNAQKAAVVNNMTGAAASCSLLGSVTWPANTKITGNVTVSNLCHVTIMGDVWITGNLTVNNTAQLAISNTVGTNMPHIMVDGSGGISMNSASLILSNLSGTGAWFYTFYSTASCSPDCSNVTGIDLANSRSLTTISLNNTAAAANSIFYAYWTQVNLTNSGQIGAVVGQTISMSNTAAITFGGASAASSTVWVIKGYRKQ